MCGGVGGGGGVWNLGVRRGRDGILVEGNQQGQMLKDG